MMPLEESSPDDQLPDPQRVHEILHESFDLDPLVDKPNAGSRQPVLITLLSDGDENLHQSRMALVRELLSCRPELFVLVDKDDPRVRSHHDGLEVDDRLSEILTHQLKEVREVMAFPSTPKQRRSKGERKRNRKDRWR